MPIIASGGNATIAVLQNQILTVQCQNGSEFTFENPVGTKLLDSGSNNVFGPFSASGNVKVNSIQGAIFYEVAGGTIVRNAQVVNSAGMTSIRDDIGNAISLSLVETVTTPNATVPVEYLAPATAYANADIAIIPKGTGGFALAAADNTTAGGNKRGVQAIDLQLSRSTSAKVASGANAVAIGADNIVSGSGALAICAGNFSTGANSLAFGTANTPSGIGAFAYGYLNACSGQDAHAFGTSNNVSGQVSYAFGTSHNVSGVRSAAIGGQFATTSGVTGQIAFGHVSDTLGRYQATLTGLRQSTVGATATRATADAAAASAANQLVLRNNSAVKFTGQVVAFDTTSLDSKEWAITGLIKRGATAATTALVGTPTAVSTFADTGAATWALAVSADTANGTLAVTVTGAGANTVRWMVQVQAYEVTA